MSLQALRKAYATDNKLETEGVWYSPPSLPHIGFKLARMSRANREWQTQFAVIYRQNKRLFDNSDLNNPVLLAKTLKLFCNTILVDWRGITNDEGTVVPYTVAAGIKLLTELPDLYEELSDEAGLKDRYRQEEADEIAGKSETT